MKKENIFLLIAIFVVLFGGMFFLKEGKKYLENKKRIEMEKLGECLLEKGVELYIISNCSYCDKQLEVFGGFQGGLKLNIINCGTSENWDKRCEKKKINSFPLWIAKTEGNLKVSQILTSCDKCKKKSGGIYCKDLCYTKTDDGKYFKIIGILELEKIKEIFGCED